MTQYSGPDGPRKDGDMEDTKRLKKLAVRLDDLAESLDPYDYESNVRYHLDMLKENPIDIIEQLVDIANELMA